VIKGEIIPGYCLYRQNGLVTNDLSQNSTDEVQEANAVRKVEEFHRGVTTDWDWSCQCRKARIQRNHIACAILAWTNLKDYLSWPLKPFINWNTNGFLSTWLRNSNTPLFPCSLFDPYSYLVSLRKSWDAYGSPIYSSTASWCHPDASTVSNAGKDQVFPATDVMYVYYTFARPKNQQVQYLDGRTEQCAMTTGARQRIWLYALAIWSCWQSIQDDQGGCRIKYCRCSDNGGGIRVRHGA